MFGIGMGELLLLLVISLIVLGPERMPKLARDLGRAMAEFRRTSDELRNEFLNADKYVDPTATAVPTEQPALPAPQAAAPPTAEVPPIPVEPDETAFDREAREARERLRDPERLERAKTEGWKTPTDEAGTSDRWG